MPILDHFNMIKKQLRIEFCREPSRLWVQTTTKYHLKTWEKQRGNAETSLGADWLFTRSFAQRATYETAFCDPLLLVQHYCGDTHTCINEICLSDRSARVASGRGGHGTSSEPWWSHLPGVWWASAPPDEPRHSNTGPAGATGRERAGILHGLCMRHNIKLGANNNQGFTLKCIKVKWLTRFIYLVFVFRSPLINSTSFEYIV